MDAPRQDLFIHIFKSAVALLVSLQIDFLCVRTGRPIQLYISILINPTLKSPGLNIPEPEPQPQNSKTTTAIKK